MSENTSEKVNQKQEWKPFFHLLKISKIPWQWYVVSLLISMGYSTIFMRLPQVTGQIMAGEIQDPKVIWTYALVTIVSSLIVIPTSLLDAWISLTTDKRLRSTIWKKIIHMPMPELDKVAPTSLVTRVTSDSSQISYAISYVFSMVTTVYGLIVALGIIGGMSVKMLLMMSLLIPCIIIATIPSHFMHNASDEAQTALSGYTNFLAERLGALKQVKASGAEEKEDAINDEAAKKLFKAKIKLAKLDFLSEPLTYGMDAVVQAIILIYGGYLMKRGEVTQADMISLFMYASTISMGAYQFVFCWQYVKKSQGETRAVGRFIMAGPEVMERQRSFAIPDADIRLEDVSFAYEDGTKILDGVNLNIQKGKVTAIVGPSGSGKTTILKLLERLYQPTEGKIMFGDIPVEEIHLNEWRESFGMVPQSSPLLFGSIQDNIAYGAEQISEDEMMKAIEAANVKEIIARIPEGLNADVGDVGSKISGGEKQRIALARMLIRDPEYLLLDEATASLDAKNEREISESLNQLMKGRTSVVVAHNLWTVRQADYIAFMEKGKVADYGSHEELYKRNERYREFVDLQSA